MVGEKAGSVLTCTHGGTERQRQHGRKGSKCKTQTNSPDLLNLHVRLPAVTVPSSEEETEAPSRYNVVTKHLVSQPSATMPWGLSQAPLP